MPKSLTFTNQYSFKIPDAEDAVDDNHDSDFDPTVNDASTASCTSSYSSHSDDSFDDDDDDDQGDNIAQPLLSLMAGVDDDHNHEADDSNHSEGNNEDNDNDDNQDDDDKDNDDNKEHINDMSMDEDHVPKINIPNAMVSTPPATPSKNIGVGGIQKCRSGGQKHRSVGQELECTCLRCRTTEQ